MRKNFLLGCLLACILGACTSTRHQEHIDKMSNENENVQRQRELDVQNNKINNVITAHDILYHHILEFFKTLKLSNVNNILFSKKNIVTRHVVCVRCYTQ